MARGTLRTALVGTLAGVLTLLVLAVALPVAFVGLLLVGTTAPWLLAAAALVVAGGAGGGATIAGYLRAGRRVDDALAGATTAALVLAAVGLVIGAFGTLVVYGFATVPVDRPMARLARWSGIVAVVGGLGGAALGALGGLGGRRLRRARRGGDGGERGAPARRAGAEDGAGGPGTGPGTGDGTGDGGAGDDEDESTTGDESGDGGEGRGPAPADDRGG